MERTPYSGQPRTLYDGLRAQTERAPESLALLAPGRLPLTFAGLLAQMETTLAQLRVFGVGRGERVAVALPSGPEMAAVCLGTAIGTTCAPLNPGYTEDEFSFYLADLKARALIVPAGAGSGVTMTPAAAAARALGLIVLELEPALDQPAGTFTLRGQTHEPAGTGGLAQGEDIALLLHTSGTTARPKLVPRTHAGLSAALVEYQRLLGLMPHYRCLSLMPQHHIQGLMALLLAPLAAGCSVVCTPGFSAALFFDWLAEFQPTWYTGSPAVHQAVVDQARALGLDLSQHSLRFIRSGAAPLSEALRVELERVFNVPLLEGYGLSEVVPLCSNPLPPGVRKPGSVGPTAGPEVAIMAADGVDLLPSGAVGEVVVRGPTVMTGYLDNPAANAQAFVDGWFRTGDQGYFDEDGYLFLTGRIKEVINHGGEKVAPAEVEAALLAHPTVAQAAAFAMPDEQYGEAVAAAVVLQPGAALDERELRRFVAARLIAFKVPRRVVAVDALPKGPTGKVKRLALAKALDLQPSAEPLAAAYEPPADALEERLARLWSRVFGGAVIGRHDDFFELGGHSLLAGGLITQMEAEFGRPLPTSLLVEAPTVAELAAALRRPAAHMGGGLVPLQPRGSRPPFFCVHDIGGDVLRFAELARLVGDDQPFYGLEAEGFNGPAAPHSDVPGMAAHYLRAVRALQPQGPYFLGGYCFGGAVAYEMACQLRDQGQAVPAVVILEGYAPSRSRVGAPRWTRERLGYFLANLPPWLADYRQLGAAYAWRRVLHVTQQLARQLALRLRVGAPLRPQDIVDGAELLPPAQLQVLRAHLQASRSYLPGPYAGPVSLINIGRQSLLMDPDPRRGWQRLARGGVTIRRIAGSHHNILQPPYVASLARALREHLENAEGEGASAGQPADVGV